jgi:hypothetical protein
MEHHFLTANRRFLKICSDMARFYGGFCLVLAGATVAILAVSAHMRSVWMTAFQPYTRVPMVVLHGLLALVVGQFIAYLLAGEERPKWLLRNGDKIMYAYAVFLLVTMGRTLPLTVRGPAEVGLGIFSVLPTVAIVLMWIGLGVTLRRLLPIIQEYKTLV